jgi:hypothetical protein
MRNSRSSSGWSTIVAMVERIRAGEGLRERVSGSSGVVGSTTIYINAR